MNGERPTLALRAFTPKEFSDAIGGILSADTIRERCRRGVLPTVNGPGRPPYLIKPDALAGFVAKVSLR